MTLKQLNDHLESVIVGDRMPIFMFLHPDDKKMVDEATMKVCGIPLGTFRGIPMIPDEKAVEPIYEFEELTWRSR